MISNDGGGCGDNVRSSAAVESSARQEILELEAQVRILSSKVTIAVDHNAELGKGFTPFRASHGSEGRC